MKPHTCTGPSCFTCKIKTLQLQPGPVMREHYNWSVGRWVNNEAQLRDEFKRAGDRNSEATGLYHNYEIRYPGDTQPIQSADYVLEDRARVLRDYD